MAGRKESLPRLSSLELEIMNIVWTLGECTSADVITAFRKKRSLANTTIRTVLANIRRKGYLELVPTVEPRIRFRARVSRRDVARRALRRVLVDLLEDSPSQAIALLLEEKTIPPQELSKIRRTIERHSS